jgi:hypothetical protein
MMRKMKICQRTNGCYRPQAAPSPESARTLASVGARKPRGGLVVIVRTPPFRLHAGGAMIERQNAWLRRKCVPAVAVNRGATGDVALSGLKRSFGRPDPGVPLAPASMAAATRRPTKPGKGEKLIGSSLLAVNHRPTETRSGSWHMGSRRPALMPRRATRRRKKGISRGRFPAVNHGFGRGKLGRDGRTRRAESQQAGPACAPSGVVLVAGTLRRAVALVEST